MDGRAPHSEKNQTNALLQELNEVLNDKQKNFKDHRSHLSALNKLLAKDEIRHLLEKNSKLFDEVSTKYNNLISRFAYQLYIVNQATFNAVPFDAPHFNVENSSRSHNQQENVISALVYEDFFKNTTTLLEKLLVFETYVNLLQRSFELGNFSTVFTLHGALIANNLISRIELIPYLSKHAKEILNIVDSHGVCEVAKPTRVLPLMHYRTDAIIPQIFVYGANLSLCKEIKFLQEDNTGQIYESWGKKLQETQHSDAELDELLKSKNDVIDSLDKISKQLTSLSETKNASDEAACLIKKEKNAAKLAQLEARLIDSIKYESANSELNGMKHKLLKSENVIVDKIKNKIDQILSANPNLYDEFQSEFNSIVNKHQQTTREQLDKKNKALDELQRLKFKLGEITAPVNEFQANIMTGLTNANLDIIQENYKNESLACKAENKQVLSHAFAKPFKKLIIRNTSPALKVLGTCLSLNQQKEQELKKLEHFQEKLTDNETVLKAFITQLISNVKNSHTISDVLRFLNAAKTAKNIKMPNEVARTLKTLCEVYEKMQQGFATMSSTGIQPRYREGKANVPLNKEQEEKNNAGNTLKKGSLLLPRTSSAQITSRLQRANSQTNLSNHNKSASAIDLRQTESATTLVRNPIYRLASHRTETGQPRERQSKVSQSTSTVEVSAQAAISVELTREASKPAIAPLGIKRESSADKGRPKTSPELFGDQNKKRSSNSGSPTSKDIRETSMRSPTRKP